jgi:hypothetical protein
MLTTLSSWSTIGTIDKAASKWIDSDCASLSINAIDATRRHKQDLVEGGKPELFVSKK